MGGLGEARSGECESERRREGSHRAQAEVARRRIEDKERLERRFLGQPPPSKPDGRTHAYTPRRRRDSSAIAAPPPRFFPGLRRRRGKPLLTIPRLIFVCCVWW